MHSWANVSLRISCSGTSVLQTRLSRGVGDEAITVSLPSCLLLLRFFFSVYSAFYFFNPSVLSLLFWLIYSFLFYLHSFHRSQSLDHVALINATNVDGSGGRPNGSLAGSVGSVAVCLPSESSLTDSLHTSAVSLQRKDNGSTGRMLVRSIPVRQMINIISDLPWHTGVILLQLIFSVLLLRW